MTTTADTIREARIRANMSQLHLAEAAGVSERTVKRAEAGERLSGETLLALSAALRADLAPEIPERARPVAYAPLVPPARTVEVEGPTGLPTHADDPARLGRLHGILAGLTLPGTCRHAGGFLKEYGPAPWLSSEAQSSSALRDRFAWIARAKAKADDPDDVAAVRAVETETWRLVLEAEMREADALLAHRAWANAFTSTSEAWRIVARALQAFACVAAALAAPNLATSLLAALGVATVSACIATLEMAHRFDRSAANDIRGRVIGRMLELSRRYAIEANATGL